VLDARSIDRFGVALKGTKIPVASLDLNGQDDEITPRGGQRCMKAARGA